MIFNASRATAFTFLDKFLFGGFFYLYQKEKAAKK